MNTSNFRATLAVFAAALFFFYEFMQVNLFNALNPGLIQTFHISGSTLGTLSAVYFYASVLFLFAGGVLIDFFSVRKIMLQGMLCLIVCTLGFGLSTAIWQVIVVRFIMGVAGCLSLTCAVKLACQWFPPNKLGTVIGGVVAFTMCGGILSQTPITFLIDHVGWRQALMLDTALGLCLFVIMLCFVKENTQAQTEPFTPLADIKTTVKNTQNWLGGIYMLFMNAPILVLGAMWGSLYLTQARMLSRAQASLVLSMIFIGMIVGAPLMGRLSDQMGKRRPLMTLAALSATITIVFIMYSGDLALPTLILLFGLLGLFGSAQVLAYPHIAENNSSTLIASAEGLAQTIMMCGGLLQPLFGYLLELRWTHTMHGQMPLYSGSNFHDALWLLPVGFTVSGLVTLLMTEVATPDINPNSHLGKRLNQS